MHHTRFHHKMPVSSALGHSDRLPTVRRFLAEQSQAICNAALLLGGTAAERRCLQLICDVRQTPTLTRHLQSELVALHRLLSLEHVSDPEAPEAAFFAAIDPADPVVFDICRLTDAVHDLLVEISSGDPSRSDGASPWFVSDAA